jgi:hypothetical protein
MCDGEIVQSGDYEELLKLGLNFGALVEAHNQALKMAEAQKLEDEPEITGPEGFCNSSECQISKQTSNHQPLQRESSLLAPAKPNMVKTAGC